MSIFGGEMTIIIIELLKYLIAEFLHAVKVDLSLNNFLIYRLKKVFTCDSALTATSERLTA